MRMIAGVAIRYSIVLVSALLLAQTPVLAVAKELPKRPFVYKAEARKLPDVLQDFAASLEMPIIIAEGVDGTVNGKFNLTPPSFLDLMSSAYSLVWYFDGNSIYVYPARATQSKVLFLRDFGADRIERLLQSLKLGDRRFPLRFDPVEKTLFVAGPPRHLELVDSMVDAISQRGREDGKRVVRIFPLKFAAANDQTVGGSTITGMVTMLNKVYGNAGKMDVPGSVGGSSAGISAMSPLDAIYGATPEAAALQAKANERVDKGMGTAASAFSLGSTTPERTPAKAASAAGAAPAEDDRPMFTSDDANNSVIVMGLPHRMSIYADLIKQLDVSSDLIEFEATIIDISHDDVASIGVNWSANTRRADAGYDSPASIAAAAASVFQLTTLSADLSRRLLVSVSALQKEGRARVIARPRVVGVANRVAVLKDTRSASVRVSGNLSSNLYSLETGTEIQVIPRKVIVEGINAIKLALSIQDGSFDTTTSVDQIPIVKRTQISTEAYVGEGEGLLIGGISSESESTNRAGLPGLSRLPFIGGMFRTDENQASRRERLFLITPRVISLAKRANLRSERAAPTGVAPLSAKLLAAVVEDKEHDSIPTMSTFARAK